MPLRSESQWAHAPKHVARKRRNGLKRGVAAVVVLAVLISIVWLTAFRGGNKTSAASSGSKGSSVSSGSSSSRSSGASGTTANSSSFDVKSWMASLEAKVKGESGNLQPGSNPSALPGPILIADEGNSRLLLVDPKGRILWQFPSPGDLSSGQTFIEPDDAFFGPTGADIMATQESQFVITEISIQSGHIIYRYGHPGTSGSAVGYLNNPDDAMLLPNGNIFTADIKNCRLLYLSPSSASPVHIYGETTPYCYHQPPLRFGSPNGVFPMANGDWLVTEINGDWVDEMTPGGQIKFSIHPPGITYPSDSNEVSAGVFLTAAYTSPGVIEEFSQTGGLLWRFNPSGSQTLNHPSIAIPLPNGNVLATDDRNDRVIVIDKKTNKIIWQYGHTGVSGTKPGYIDEPDGVDLAPPYSLLITQAPTMGIPPFQPVDSTTPTTGG